MRTLNKIALVTGAARGIGQATAELLHKEGATVIISAIMTPMWETMLGEGEQRQQMIDEIESGIPLGHFGNPMDVAYGILFLANDESSYITGIELTIDGGILAGSEAKPKK